MLISVLMQCGKEIKTHFYIPEKLELTNEYFIGQSISDIKKNSTINYDEYCNCYYYLADSAKLFKSIYFNSYSQDKSGEVSSIQFNFDKGNGYTNAIIAENLIDKLINVFGMNYRIFDVPTLSKNFPTKPRIVWVTNDSVYVSILFMPKILVTNLYAEQKFVMHSVQLEFSIKPVFDFENNTESEEWTRDRLCLK